MNKYKMILLIPTAVLAVLLSGCKNTNAKNANEAKETGWIITKNATCTEDGEKVRTLSSGKKEYLIIKATGHTITEDEEIPASCTEDGLTAGEHCEVCGEVLKKQEVISAHHTASSKNGVAPTCTRAGRSSSSVCTVCGEEVKEEIKIRPLGHKYANGYCTRCNTQKPDCVELSFADFSEGSPTTFITKKAYPGGSTVTFSAYVPKGIPEQTWWGIAWTTDKNTANIYDCASPKNGKPLMNISVKGKWSTYTATLPDDGKSYYVYLGGPAGYSNWNGKNIKIDDFVIKNASGKVLANETFNDGYENSIFNVNQISDGIAVKNTISCPGGHNVKTLKGSPASCISDGLTDGEYCKKCGKIIKAQTVIPSAKGHDYDENFVCKKCGKTYENIAAKVYVSRLNENGESDFITKKAYPGGSTVKVRVKAPAGTQWWGFGFNTDKSKTSVYDAADYTGKTGKAINNSTGEWQTVTFNLPDDGKKYYIYVGGPREVEYVLIDDFTVYGKNGSLIEDCDFDNGISNSIFSISQVSFDGKSGIAENYIWEHGHKIVVDPAVKATCTTPGKTEGKICSVCGKVISKSKVIPALRIDKGHEYVDGECKYCHHKYQNRCLGIYTKNIVEEKNVNFITKKKYKGGTKITFDAYIPKETNWWGIAWTTDASKANIYEPAYGKTGIALNNPANNGKWATYSVTLPDDNKEYYIYFGTSVGEVGDKPFLFDNFIFTKGAKTLDTCYFDDGITAKNVTDIFDINEIGTNDKTVVTSEPHDYYSPCKKGHKTVDIPAVKATCTTKGKTAGKKCSVCGEIIVQPTEINYLSGDGKHHYDKNGKCIYCHNEKENMAVAIYTRYLVEESWANFISAKKYKGGTTVTFDAYVPAGTSWWGIAFTTDKAKTSIYDVVTAKGVNLADNAKLGKWETYTVTLPDDGNEYYFYFGAPVGEIGDNPVLLDDFVIKDKESEVIDKCNFDDGIKDKTVTDVFNINTSGLNSTTAAGEISHDYYSPCKSGHTLVDIPAVEATCTTKGKTAGKKCSVCGEVIVKPEEVNYLSGDGKHHYDENNVCIYCHLPKENEAVAIYTKNLVEESWANFISAKKYKGGTTVTFDAYVPKGTTWWGIAFTTDKTKTSIYDVVTDKGVNLADSAKLGKWETYTVTLPDDGNEYYFYFGAPVGEIGDNPFLLDNFVIKNKESEVIDKCDFDDGITDKTVTDVFNINTSGLNSTIAVSEVSHDYYNPCRKGHTLVDIPAVEATCTTKGKTAGKKCSVCGEIIEEPVETEYLSPDGKHHYEDGECIYCHEEESLITEDMAIAIEIKNLSTDKADLISSKAYKGGTTITFDAYVPTAKSSVTNSWWGIAWSTSSTLSGINGSSKPSNAVSLYSTSKLNKWATYTVNLPDDGNDYYFYVIGPSGNKAWNNGKKVYIDNIKITDSSGTVIGESNFNVKLDSNGIFTINGSDSVVTLAEHDSAGK